ncbi:MAG: nucleotidyltransferase family protein [Rivularia sp. ALOHA_DT_140]|nr:nucleotidyltransferase family protein [Rivularia sp. ALOHA_DT_140]
MKELLTFCARSNLQPLEIEKIKTLVEQETDWKQLIEIANVNKVIPLLYQNINSICPELVPKQVLIQLKQQFQFNATRNLFITSELIKLLNLFESYGIHAIPIKGVVLAVCAYGNVALRQFGDLDILVRQEDAIKARDLLVSEGYESTYNFTREQEIARLKSPYCKDNNYFHKHTKVNLDFHWQLLQKYLSFPLKHEELWQRHETIAVAGKTVRNLSPEDNLLFLCIHASRDRWNKLRLVSDVTQLIERYPDINWEWLIEKAKQLGCKRRLLLGLILAKNLLEAELPQMIIQNIEKEPELNLIAKKLTQKLFEQNDTPATSQERYLFDLSIRERILDKVNYSVHQSIIMVARKNGILPAWI